MKTRLRQILFGLTTLGILFCCAAWPVLAAEDAAPDPTDTPTGIFFRWLNFLLVAGGIAYVLAKFGGPFFRARGLAIAQKIREVAESHAAAERDLAEAERLVAQLPAEAQELRRTAIHESAAEAERIAALTRSDVEKIAAAGRAEIDAAERAGRHELRVLASRLAIERAEVLLRQRLNAGSQAKLFHAFVAQLPGAAQ